MEVASKLGVAPEKNPGNVSDPCAQAACDRLALLDHVGGESSRRHGGDAMDEGVDPCPRAASGPAHLLLQIRHDAPRTNLPSPMREGISGRLNRVARRALAPFSSTASGREVNRSAHSFKTMKGLKRSEQIVQPSAHTSTMIPIPAAARPPLQMNPLRLEIH